MSLTPLEHALWDLGYLDSKRQEALDGLCRGNQDDLPACLQVTVDPSAYKIAAGSLSGGIERLITLPRADGTYAVGGPHGLPAIMVFDDNMRKVGEFPVDEAPAILLVEGCPCRYTKAFRSQAYLPFSPYAAAMLVPEANSAYGPIDLMVSPSGEEALALDRHLGTIYRVDLRTGTLSSRIKVRITGLGGALSVAWLDNRLLVVDASAGKLLTFDARDGAMVEAPADQGSVISLVASPDGGILYLLATKPVPHLLAVEADGYAPLWKVPLTGEPFNHLGDPLGQLAISPDGRKVMAVTAIAEPAPGTPVITVVDTVERKPVQRLRLQAARRPAAVAFGLPNPYHADLPTVDAAIVKLGLMTEVELEQLKEGLGQFEPGEEWPETTIELADLAEGADWRGGVIAPADFVELPVEIEPVIAEYLHRSFLDQTGADLRLDEQAWEKVCDAAAACRQQLEVSTGAIADLPGLMAGHSLRVSVSQDQVMEWLEVLAEADSAMSEVLAELELIQGLDDVPERCPACRAPLYGSYVCPGCSHAVISDAALEALVMAVRPRANLLADSADPQLFLPPGHMLVPDPARQRVVELDSTCAIIWSLEPERMEASLKNLLQWPVDALRLANGNTLIVDRGGRRVFEVTPTGRPYWEWPASAGRLGEPVRVARSEWGETYIVDRQGHRIWRADANGQPLTGYGEGMAGIAEGQLCRPSDVQILGEGHLLIADTGNHRVIEVADGRLVWQFGNRAGEFEGGAGSGDTELDAPQRALRLASGETLILDTGNHRLLLIDPHGAIVKHYDTILGDPAVDVKRPLRMVRLPEGRLAYWDQQRLVEIDSDGRLAWAADLAKLDANPRLQAPEERDEAGERVWQVKALAQDDPERQAIEAEKSQRREEGKVARQIWSDGDTPALFVHLKAVAKRRTGNPSAPRHWKIDLAALERLVAENRILLKIKSQEVLARKVAAAPTALPTPPLPVAPAFRTRPAPEAADLGESPVPLLVVQRSSNRLVMLARNQKVLWSWGMAVLLEPNAAVMLPDHQVLVTDTGHRRILRVDIDSSEILWQTPSHLELQSPRSATRLDNGHLLIADAGSQRILEIDTSGSVVWQWRSESMLVAPSSAERLENGNTLIADGGNHLVLEVDPAGKVVWTYGQAGVASKSPGFLNQPEQASRRATGHTLIVDGRNHRILDVDPSGTVAWSYASEGVNRLSGPTAALVLGSSVWIAHGGGRQLFEVSRAGEVKWRIERPI